jgi:hypothetical protein
MIERQVTLPTIALIAGTRVALGVGIGLLLADRLEPAQRRAAGMALLTVGALSTIPLLAEVFGAEHGDPANELRVEHNPIRPYITAASTGEGS